MCTQTSLHLVPCTTFLHWSFAAIHLADCSVFGELHWEVRDSMAISRSLFTGSLFGTFAPDATAGLPMVSVFTEERRCCSCFSRLNFFSSAKVRTLIITHSSHKFCSLMRHSVWTAALWHLSHGAIARQQATISQVFTRYCAYQKYDFMKHKSKASLQYDSVIPGAGVHLLWK